MSAKLRDQPVAYARLVGGPEEGIPGSVAINATMTQLGAQALPFGVVGASGFRRLPRRALRLPVPTLTALARPPFTSARERVLRGGAHKEKQIWTRTGEEEGTIMILDDIELTTLRGEHVTFGQLTGGKVALVVNVASRCGLAPQYEQLEELQQHYGDAGFTVIGLPSNQFRQELGSSDDIAEYCSATWGVTFPMTETVKVNGRDAHPLYRALKKSRDHLGVGGPVAWNFEKFLVHPDGRVKRFRPNIRPDAPEVTRTIEEWTDTPGQSEAGDRNDRNAS